MKNYYQKNLETEKLNIHTTMEFYKQLPDEQRKLFTSYCLWSRTQDCWVSKGKADNCNYLKNQLESLGFTDKGTVGERISFEEQVEREQARAEQTIGRSEKRAEKADKNADNLLERAREMAAIIPFGQPILVGHHSEKRDRNYRDKIHNTYGKAFQEQDKASYYRGKVDAARETAEGKKYTNPLYLNKCIKECTKNIKLFERRLQGKFYAHSPEHPIAEETRLFYIDKLAVEQDKLDFYLKRIKELELKNPVAVIVQKKRSNHKGI